MNQLQILHVYKDYPPVEGGIEGTVARLARGQAGLGHAVTVLTTAPWHRRGTRTEDGVRIIRTWRPLTLASTPLSPGLWSALARTRPDVTHLHFPYPWGEVGHLLFGRSRSTVVTYHSDVVKQRVLGRALRPVALRVLRAADRILPTSPPYIESSPLLRHVADRCEVVPLGIDTERFVSPPAEAVERFRKELGNPFVLFVGCLRYYKGLPVLFEALERIPTARLVVAGRGREESALHALAASSSARGRIRFLGHVPEEDLPSLLGAAAIFVLPSVLRSEAFGLAQVEAMAAGRPVISTALGTGTDWVNRHGETGLVVPPRDPAALAQAIRELLEDSGRRARLGEAARRRAVDELSTPRMVGRTLRIYEDILPGEKSRETRRVAPHA